jgi:hypothetical protein
MLIEVLRAAPVAFRDVCRMQQNSRCFQSSTFLQHLQNPARVVISFRMPPLLDVVRSFLPVADWELYIAVVEWQDGFAWSRLLNHRGLRICGGSNGNYDMQPLPLAEQAVVER